MLFFGSWKKVCEFLIIAIIAAGKKWVKINSAGWRGGKKVFFPASFSDIVYNETIILSLCKGEYP